MCTIILQYFWYIILLMFRNECDFTSLGYNSTKRVKRLISGRYFTYTVWIKFWSYDKYLSTHNKDVFIATLFSLGQRTSNHSRLNIGRFVKFSTPMQELTLGQTNVDRIIGATCGDCSSPHCYRCWSPCTTLIRSLNDETWIIKAGRREILSLTWVLQIPPPRFINAKFRFSSLKSTKDFPRDEAYLANQMKLEIAN